MIELRSCRCGARPKVAAENLVGPQRKRRFSVRCEGCGAETPTFESYGVAKGAWNAERVEHELAEAAA